MYTINNYPERRGIKTLCQSGAFTVIEYRHEPIISPLDAQNAYFRDEMWIYKRQIICNLKKSNITLRSGTIQWAVGNINTVIGCKGIEDCAEYILYDSVKCKAGVKWECSGDGILVLEPTYQNILLINLDDWEGCIVLNESRFLACDNSLQHKAVSPLNLSSAVIGNEGMFELEIVGEGILCLESPCFKEELIKIELKNDVLKVDGNMAIAWSGSLEYTVERSGKTLIGSAASGEGLVNVYRGTGKVLLAPVAKGFA